GPRIGEPDEPPRPRAEWTSLPAVAVADAPADAFRPSDVAKLRSQRPLVPSHPSATSWRDPPNGSGGGRGGAVQQRGDAWCALTDFANGDGGQRHELCISDKGIAGTAFATGEGMYAYRCGVGR